MSGEDAKPLKSRLIWKLLLVHVVVIGCVMVIMWWSIDTLAAGYFVTLMERYHISPGPAHAMFVDAVHRYLLWSCLAAVSLAVVLSYLLMRRVLSPLTRMTHIAREIAAGDFNGRVPASSTDEVGQLAAAFNKMAQGLEQMETLRRNLMIDVAHELRTPLTNLRGYLEALQDEVLPPSPDTLAMLHNETLRLVDLVEDVLALARADAARDTLRREPVALAERFTAVQSAFAVRLKEKRIRFSLDIAADLPCVEADGRHIDRVFRSLMDNAVRYTPDHGDLVVRMAARSRHVRVALSNTNDDLTPDALPYLFERFYRGEKSRSRAHGGAGIGLSIVKELVAAHGGSVGAEIDDGRVTIWFELPLTGADSGRQPVPAKTAVPPA